MNYKDIVKRLKCFNFSKKQKENLANIIDNTFEIEVDFENNCIIFNDKSFNGTYSSSSIGDIIHIYNIELYNILKTNLINTYKHVYIKSASSDSRYIFTPASCIIAEDRCTFYMHTSEVILAIIIHNENEDE